MNVKYENGELIITIPASLETIKAAPPSSSGKSRMIASTKGFATVPGAPQGLRIGLNVIANL